MIVRVTQELIDGGSKDNCKKSPVAMALCVATGRPAFVESWRWRHEGMMENLWMPLPFKARMFIRLFDRSEPVAPFEFEIPDEVAK